MRLALLPFLLPALAAAQDVPSLQRPNPALPITASVEVLRTRLGAPGGAFAAAQLALLGADDALRAAARDADPLRRLDAAFGLEGLDRPVDLLTLASLLGDPDPRVSGEATTAFRRLGRRGASALYETALHGGDAAGNAAAYLLGLSLGPEAIADVARTPTAAGRATAFTFLPQGAKNLPVALDAANDPRRAVREAAVGWIFGGERKHDRQAAVDRLLDSPSPEVRAALAWEAGGQYRSDRDGLLLTLARDPSPLVRKRVAEIAGGRLYDDGQHPLFLPLTMRLVGDPDPRVADAAFEGIATFVANHTYAPSPVLHAGSPEARALLWEGLRRRLKGSQPFRAALVLAELRDARAYPYLEHAAFESKGGERLEAIHAVGAAGDRRATSRLLALTRDGDANDMNAAYPALGFLRDPASVPPLLAVVRREPLGWGVQAAYALARIGDRAATPTLLAAARGVGPYLDSSYALPLAILGGPGVREFLLERLANDRANAVPEIGRGLIELRDPAAIPELTRIAAGSGPRAEEAKRVLTSLNAKRL